MSERVAIDIRGLTYAYPDGTLALGGLDLRIAEGERVALLGPNGAGKSTLMLNVNGVIRGDGEVTVGGIRLTDETLREVRSRVGLVFQDPDDQLFMTTLYDDVAFGPLNMGLTAEDVDARVHRALHAVGLADETSRPAHHLSFGQRKRAALATVLAMDPAVLVLDEPTSNLDPRSRRRMIELLRGLPATQLVATHDMDLAWRLCERAVLLDGGCVAADGPADELLADADLLEAHGLELPPSLSREGGRG